MFGAGRKYICSKKPPPHPSSASSAREHVSALSLPDRWSVPYRLLVDIPETGRGGNQESEAFREIPRDTSIGLSARYATLAPQHSPPSSSSSSSPTAPRVPPSVTVCWTHVDCLDRSLVQSASPASPTAKKETRHGNCSIYDCMDAYVARERWVSVRISAYVLKCVG